MPAFCKCQVPGCTFEGAHGFDSTVGNLMRFWHTGSHEWYKGTLPDGREFTTTDKIEAFEKCVVPRVLAEAKPGSALWVEAWRARLSGHERKATKLFNQWTDEGLGTSKARR